MSDIAVKSDGRDQVTVQNGSVLESRRIMKSCAWHTCWLRLVRYEGLLAGIDAKKIMECFFVLRETASERNAEHTKLEGIELECKELGGTLGARPWRALVNESRST